MNRLAFIGVPSFASGCLIAAPGTGAAWRGTISRHSLSARCVAACRARGWLGMRSLSQGREVWSSHVVHTHKIAGSNPAPATSLPSLKLMPRSCGPP